MENTRQYVMVAGDVIITYRVLLVLANYFKESLNIILGNKVLLLYHIASAHLFIF